MESSFSSLLVMVNDWLKYAEAKNGILIALASGTIWGSLNIMSGKFHSCWLRIYLINLTIFCLIALVLSVLSFLPITSGQIKPGNAAKNQTDNLLFFADIAKYEPEEFAKLFAKLINNDDTNALTSLEQHYSEQIVANSRIATKKLELFNKGALSVSAGFLTPIGTMIILCVLKGKGGFT